MAPDRGPRFRASTSTPRPLKTYLKRDEQLYHLLTNMQVGIERSGGEAASIRPGENGKAYLGLTDRRLIILVTDPVAHDGDFVTSHRYANIAEVAAARETLTARIEFETEYGRGWSFTARESDIEPVRTYLTAVCGGSRSGAAVRIVLEDHCTSLSNHLRRGEWDAFDELVAAALETVGTLEDEGDVSMEWGEPVPSISRDIHCLVRDRHVLAGREALASAAPRLEAGDLELAYRRARTAYDEFERALERAQRESLSTENALVGLTRADDIADTSLGRLFATARERYNNALERPSGRERVEPLEATLERYETIGALVTGDETLSDQARDRARTEAIAVMESLLAARLESARERRQAADWERAVENEATARELAAAARTDFERALELAESYPPGDADEIRAGLSALAAEFDIEA